VDSVIKPSLLKPASGNLRAYLAGTGATGALVAGAAVVFLSAIAFVAFNGFSFPGSGYDSSVSLARSQPARLAQAPIAAAAAVGPGAGAVAATPTVVGPGAILGPGATGPGTGLNQAGGAAGNPHLGDQTNDAVRGATDGIIGNGGLLGGN